MTDPKVALRSTLLSARSAIPSAERARRDQQIAENLVSLLHSHVTTRRACVAGFVPLPGEPGGSALLATMFAHSHQLLLPRTPSKGALSWSLCASPNNLRVGRFGIGEPTGPILPASTIADADLVIIPALGIDRQGYRLGRGRGYYDQSLILCRPETQFVAIVDDEEVIDDVYPEEHDVPVHIVVTPTAALKAPIWRSHY